MNLENAVKYFSPKSPSLSDSPCCTGEKMTGTDVMAAIGMCQAKVGLGMSAFLGKVEVSNRDKEQAVSLLRDIGFKLAAKVAAIRKLTPVQRLKVVDTLSFFAYQDYCRSAAGTVVCDECFGKGMIQVWRDVVKYSGLFGADGSEKIPKLVVHKCVDEKCNKCDGKGTISTACRDCKGRGEVVTEGINGAPVRKPCKRCDGVGFKRLPASSAYRVIKNIVGELPESSWRNSYKPLYQRLITELHKAESVANSEIGKVTRS